MFGENVKDEYMTSIGEKNKIIARDLVAINEQIATIQKDISSLQTEIKNKQDEYLREDITYQKGDDEKVLNYRIKELELRESQLDSLNKNLQIHKTEIQDLNIIKYSEMVK
jgi:hypothetical protein